MPNTHIQSKFKIISLSEEELNNIDKDSSSELNFNLRCLEKLEDKVNAFIKNKRVITLTYGHMQNNNDYPYPIVTVHYKEEGY